MNKSAARTADLRRMLTGRHREIHDAMQRRLRDGRIDRLETGGDTLEDSDDALQRDLELSLLQMRAATVRRINEALVRLDAGEYGCCAECAGEIAERRLRALPFAVRCQACEERREQSQGHARRLAERRDLPLFADAGSPETEPADGTVRS